uniref:Uncharacterized protein n=1 Tax=Cucumis melo TaxID=3656 RepID=A0A9I9EFF2_CUCME
MSHDKPPTNIRYSSLPAISSSGFQGEKYPPAQQKPK